MGLSLEGDRAEDDLAVDAVPPVARRHPLHEHVVRQRRQERRPSKHLAQESDRLHGFDSYYLGYVKRFLYETFAFELKSRNLSQRNPTSEQMEHPVLHSIWSITASVKKSSPGLSLKYHKTSHGR